MYTQFIVECGLPRIYKIHNLYLTRVLLIYIHIYTLGSAICVISFL